MEMEMTGDKPRIIKLLCPSLSTIVPFVAWDEQLLDIGSLARTFGLDPSTVKLNGHFISRGVDLISSSVTWKSLLSFFSSKGLPTGKSDKDALLVDGKLCKVGVKRAHDPQEIENGHCCEADEEDSILNGRRQAPEVNLVKNKKLKHRDSGSKPVGDFPVSKCNPKGCKRKQYMEDVILLKKLKLNETKSVFDELSDAGGGINDMANAISRTAYSCSYNSENMKRMREDEPLVFTLCKKN